MNNNTDQIRIYAACLAAYKNGILHGAWIVADQHADAIMAEISAMLKASPIAGAEEWAIHDYEGFHGVSISEYQGIESITAIAAFLREHGEVGTAVMAYFGDLDEAVEAMDERYAGTYSSIADFAQELTEETSEVPDHLQAYIDYERMGRDMGISDVLAIETGIEEVHIFWCH